MEVSHLSTINGITISIDTHKQLVLVLFFFYSNGFLDEYMGEHLHLLYKLWILHILATSITEETCIVEMRIWCRKIGTVNVIVNDGYCILYKPIARHVKIYLSNRKPRNNGYAVSTKLSFTTQRHLFGV